MYSGESAIIYCMPKKVVRNTRKRTKKHSSSKGGIGKLVGFLFVVAGFIFLVSLGFSGSIFFKVNTWSIGKFGSLHFLFPFLLIFLGLFCMRLKMFLSRVHLVIGYIMLFFALDGLFRGGGIGVQMADWLGGILGGAGAEVVFFVALFVGMVVFFDTSMDELFEGTTLVFRNVPRFFPWHIFSRGSEKDKGFVAIKSVRGNDEDKEEVRPKVIRAIPERMPEVAVLKKEESMPITSNGLINPALQQQMIWEYPPLSLLSEAVGQKADRGNVKQIASNIERTLESFGVKARVVEHNPGPAVTQYALEIALGTKVSKITSLANDLALATEAPTGQIRIEAPIPGRNLVGIEIPNRSLEEVTMSRILKSSQMQKSKSKLTLPLGLDVSGDPIVADLARMPHLLIAGTTGSGKSVAINAFITSLLFRASPNEVKFIMIDPKRVEMSIYNGIPHLLTPVIVEADKILSSLKWAVGEMEHRYKLLADQGVRNIDSYNELVGFQALPYIVILIDELADLMSYAPVEVEDTITRLAQMARAVGIHLVVATQRPSVDVITGLIKANIPSRVAFNVSSMMDSRVILDMPGAEKLLGRGDMLYIPPDQAKPSRIQGTFVSEKEVKKLVEFLKARVPEVHYTEEVTKQVVTLKKGSGGVASDVGDEFFDEAIRVVCQYDRASASLLQRKLSIGYSRAARILDSLEEMGVVGHAEGSKPRDVLVKNAEEFITARHES